MQLYYESLCPDSISFIKNQLLPNWAEFSDFLEVEFVIYGNAVTTPDPNKRGYSFKCQHGPNECSGNMYQACLLDLIKNIPEDVQKKVPVIGCIMSAPYPDKATVEVRKF